MQQRAARKKGRAKLKQKVWFIVFTIIILKNNIVFKMIITLCN